MTPNRKRTIAVIGWDVTAWLSAAGTTFKDDRRPGRFVPLDITEPAAAAIMAFSTRQHAESTGPDVDERVKLYDGQSHLEFVGLPGRKYLQNRGLETHRLLAELDEQGIYGYAVVINPFTQKTHLAEMGLIEAAWHLQTTTGRPLLECLYRAAKIVLGIDAANHPAFNSGNFARLAARLTDAILVRHDDATLSQPALNNFHLENCDVPQALAIIIAAARMATALLIERLAIQNLVLARPRQTVIIINRGDLPSILPSFSAGDLEKVGHDIFADRTISFAQVMLTNSLSLSIDRHQEPPVQIHDLTPQPDMLTAIAAFSVNLPRPPAVPRTRKIRAALRRRPTRFGPALILTAAVTLLAATAVLTGTAWVSLIMALLVAAWMVATAAPAAKPVAARAPESKPATAVSPPSAAESPIGMINRLESHFANGKPVQA